MSSIIIAKSKLLRMIIAKWKLHFNSLNKKSSISTNLMAKNCEKNSNSGVDFYDQIWYWNWHFNI